MIRYQPGLPAEEVNYSRTSPLVQMVQLLGATTLILLALYWLAGLAVNLIAERFPRTMEPVLTGLADATLPLQPDLARPDETARLNVLLATLTAHLDGQDQPAYRVEIVDDPMVNALAMPGGRIVVFSGLLEQVRDDGQMLFVLAHELGHFRNRDHIKRFGRGVVAVFLSALVTGQDSSLTTLAGTLLGGVESGYSRSQELAADRFGLELLDSASIPRQGALDFMRTIMEQDTMHRSLYYFSSHPSPEDRLAAMEQHGG